MTHNGGIDLIKKHTFFGFDLQTTKIKTHGLYGGDTLPKVTYDHWKLVISEPKSDDKPFENYLVKRIYLIAPDESTLSS